MSKQVFYIFLFSVALFFTSCYPKKKLTYIQEEEGLHMYNNVRKPKTIQPQDYLYIKVFSLEPAVSEIFQNRNTSVGGDVKLFSYQVNENGVINFPFVGNIDVKGLTIHEAQVKIENLLSEYLKNISITVRFIGNKLTILGEVASPGSYQYFDDKINIFEAIGLAKGIDVYGDKSKVVIVREINNEIKYYDIDLTSRDVALSEYYYLLPNDIVFVTPIRAKYRTYRDLSLYSTLLSTVSTFITVLYFIARN